MVQICCSDFLDALRDIHETATQTYFKKANPTSFILKSLASEIRTWMEMIGSLLLLKFNDCMRVQKTVVHLTYVKCRENVD